MGFQTVQWTSYNRLSCTSCVPSDVILCLADGEKVAQKTCPLDPLVAPETTEETDFLFSTVAAELITAGRMKNQCGQTFYSYVFRYDDALLVPATVLIPSDIIGVVCRGCLTTYIDETVGSDIKLEFVDGDSEEGEFDTYLLTGQHGCAFEFPAFGGVLSATSAWDPGNILDGASTSSTFTVTGAELGDAVALGFDGDIDGMQLTGYVSLADTVRVVLSNLSGAPKDTSGTLTIKVFK